VILIDTSAWIEFFRARGEPAVKSRVADCLSNGQAAYTCPIRFELLSGARRDETATVLEGLEFARRIELTAIHWDTAAAHGAKLRARGITVPASDLLIATVVDMEGLALLSRDRHFEMVRDAAMPQLRLMEFFARKSKGNSGSK
jgi:predicted nucleic acid-binding protein